MKKRLSQSHPLLKLLLWVAVTLVFFAALAATMMFAGKGDADELSYLRTVQALQSLLVFILPAIAATWCWSGSPFSDLRMTSSGGAYTLVLAVLVMLCAIPAVNMLADWNSRLVLPSFLSGLEATLKAYEEAAAALTERFLQADNLWELTGNICLMAFLPALSEELCFRGVLLNLCLNGGNSEQPVSKKRAHLSVWVTAALFSFIHFQFYGFVPRMLLGALFGYMVLWSGSLWTSVLAHFANNATAVITYYICAHSPLDAEQVDSFGTGGTLWAGILSMAVAVAIAVLMRNVCQRQSSAPLP